MFFVCCILYGVWWCRKPKKLELTNFLRLLCVCVDFVTFGIWHFAGFWHFSFFAADWLTTADAAIQNIIYACCGMLAYHQSVVIAYAAAADDGCLPGGLPERSFCCVLFFMSE